ncbi:MAG: glycosyltransferase [Candidatus Cloacimonadota bacterium]|nr:MAG: glycosyltransferase [Candidatus Cloacimonadota bacterium]
MKIALVSLQFEETATGGGGVHVKNICEQFLKEGHNVTLISIHTEKTLNNVQLVDWDVPFSIQSRGNLIVVRFLIDKNISQPYVGEKNVELNRIERFAKAAIKWIKNENYEFDVINLHGHHILPGLMAKELKSEKTKVVSTIHALESTFISQKGESLGSFNATQEVLAKLRRWEGMSRFADFIIVNSPTVHDDFQEILKGQNVDVEKFTGKIKLISSGCNENFRMSDEEIKQKLSQVPEKINLVTFCRIDPSKGIEYSINGAKAAARLCSCKLCLFIVGIPASDEYLKSLYSELEEMPENLEIKFKLFNAISPPKEKKKILDNKHIYILPTLKEPFGMSIIEASARGNLIISTDSTGPKYMTLGENDEHFDWGITTDYGVLAKITEDHHTNLANNIGKAIVWTIDNWQRCAQSVLAFNKKIKQKWTWEGIGKQYLALFQRR